MTEWDPLRVEYTTVTELTDFITYAVESISLGLDRWDQEYVRGPGPYVVVVTGVHSGQYADPLGENTWPTETCRVVTDDLDGFVEAARTVGLTRDGAVIISTDGTIQEQMVRVKSQSDRDTEAERTTVNYADWMGTKHLSAIEVSVREEVVAAITLIEDNQWVGPGLLETENPVVREWAESLYEEYRAEAKPLDPEVLPEA